MYNRPKQEHEYDQRQESLIATLAKQESYNWKDNVIDIPSLPVAGNSLNDIRKVLSDGYVRRWDGSNWVMLQPSGGGGTNLQQWDASGGEYPPHTAGESGTWIITVGGTLPAPTGEVFAGDYLLWDGYDWSVIPNNSDMYINPGQNNIAVGGIEANAGPFNDPMQVMWNRLLYPYIKLTANLTTSPSYSTYYEKGINIADIDLTANFDNSQNPRHPVTEIRWKRDGSTIDTMSDSDISSPQEYTETNTVDDTTSFNIEVEDESGEVATSARTFHFVYPMYGGHSDADEYLNWNTVSDLDSALGTKRVRPKENTAITDTYSGKRSLFIYPSSYGNLSSIIDDNGFNTISDYDKLTKDYVAQDGGSVSYTIYQLKADASQTDFTNNYNF